MKTYQAIAEFYDDEYADHDATQHDVGFYLSLLPKRRQRVLALACGTAREAIPLAQAGHEVVGVDLDPAMIAIAKRKRDSVGLSAKQLDLRTQDLLQLRLPGSFDHACMLFTTFICFTTLAEQDRVLANVGRCLRKGGTLCIDVFNPDMAMIADERRVDVSPSVFFSTALQRTVERRVTIWSDRKRLQVRHTRFDYRWHDDHGRLKQRSVQFGHTWFAARELQMLLERNRFEVVQFFGDHTGGPLTPKSPRLIAWSRRR